MTIWYRLDSYLGWKADSHISPVEVERHTEHCVFMADGRRRNRYGDPSFYPTWAEAHEAHVARALAKHNSAQIAYDRVCRDLAEAKAMKEPQP